jgi:hypothetical protein
MFLDLISLALVLAFAICFKCVSTGFTQACDNSSAKELTEQQMAARFIAVAIQQYELRNTKPGAAIAKKFEIASEKQDDLVEEYYLALQANIEDVKQRKLKPGLHLV